MDLSNLPSEENYRFVAVLNKKIETGRLMNALGHMTAGLAGSVGDAKAMHFLEYFDKDGVVHPGQSHFPFIILSADNSNKIRTVRHEAVARSIPFVDFTSTMRIGTTQVQMDATIDTKEIDLEYYGIVMFGKTEDLKEFTKKFSLYK